MAGPGSYNPTPLALESDAPSIALFYLIITKKKLPGKHAMHSHLEINISSIFTMLVILYVYKVIGKIISFVKQTGGFLTKLQ